MATTNANSVLNLNRFELRQVKNAFNSNRANYKKLEKLYEKVRELGAEIDTIQKMIDSWEAPIKQLTLSRCGVELTSKEVLDSYENPQKFVEEHPLFNEEAADSAVEASEPEDETDAASEEDELNNPFGTVSI